jgi:hypothetical protein
LNSNILSHWFYWAELPVSIKELGSVILKLWMFFAFFSDNLVCWFDCFLHIILNFSWMDYWTPPSAMHASLWSWWRCCSGESATPPVCCSSPSNRPDWTDSHQHIMGQSGPAHPPSTSYKMVTKNLCSMQDVHETSFSLYSQCPVANHNVLAMYQASRCISINVLSSS